MNEETTKGGGSDPIEDLVGELLSRIECEGLGALDAMCDEHPDDAEALRSRVGWLVERGLVTPGRDQEVPTELGPFQLLEMLGSGAMGVVYRARDVTLQREVALKVVRPEQLYFPGARERFQNEVAAVASLQHPGIVPVHSVGEQDGVPYFAMELVRGATLADVIEHLHVGGKSARELDGEDLVRALVELTEVEPDGPDPIGSPLFEGPWPTVVARIVLEVAEALEHAHRRGILHRDIKPSNVMVTPGGRVMLVDFGLSRSEAASDSTAQTDRLTKTGHVVGSLAYVAPEFLDGRSKANVSTDVWSLGVTLFELLATELPGGRVDPRLRASILAEAVGRLREGDPRISWELETIAQTALELDPERRYASAGELAHDLSCALAGREIVARRAGLSLRLRRWAERHPGRSTAAVLSLFVLTLGPALFAWQQTRANRALAKKAEEVQLAYAEAKDQRDAARTALERAERHFDHAITAIDLVLNEFRSGQTGLDSDRSRVRILEAALSLNEQMLDQPESGARQAVLTIEAMTRIAEIRSMLGRHDEALESLDEQLVHLERSVDLIEPAEWDLWYADNLRLKCTLLGFMERREEAIEVGREAVRAAERLVVEHGSEFLGAVGKARLDLGQLLRLSGRHAEGREELDRAIDELRPMAEASEPLSPARMLLASALANRGTADDVIFDRRPTGAELDRRLAALDEAIELREEIVALQPTPLDRRRLAQALMNRGSHLIGSPRWEQALQDIQRAADLAAELAREDPNIPLYRQFHGSTLYALVGALPNPTNAQMRAHLETACSELARAVELDPHPFSYKEMLVLAAGALVAVCVDDGDPAAAEAPYGQVAILARQLAEVGRLTPPTARVVRHTIGRFAEGLIALERLTEAAEVARTIDDYEPPPDEQIFVAWYLFRCAATVLDLARPTSNELRDTDQWIGEAVIRVEEALAAGAHPARTRATLFDDPELGVLDDHPVWGAFREELEAR